MAVEANWLKEPDTLFARNTFLKGRAYAYEGRVLEIDRDTEEFGAIYALVRGSERKPYEVTIAFDIHEPDAVDLECTCPVGWKCKHTAAVLVAYTERIDMRDVAKNWRTLIDTSYDWFQIGVEVEVGGEKLSLLPIILRALRDPHIPLTLDAIGGTTLETLWIPTPDGRSVGVPTVRLQKLLGILSSLYHSKDMKLPIVRLTEVSEWKEELDRALHGADAALGKAVLNLKSGLDRPTSTPMPEELQFTLRSYQQAGVVWLERLHRAHLGGVLADDMGLGKTVQTLTHIARMSGEGEDRPSLVICPTSVMDNWIDEAERALPQLKVLRHHGPHRKAKYFPFHDVVVTSYAVARRDAEILAQGHWNVIVLDEAQMVKNVRTKTYRSLLGLKGNQRLCLSGTPVENHLGDLWALLNWSVPGLMGTRTEFSKRYTRILEKGSNPETIRSLHSRVGPFLLRRTKEEVAKELPPKTTVVRRCELGRDQRDLYETIRVSMDRKVRKAIKERGMAGASLEFLQALTRMRLLCCDPSLVDMEEAKGITDSAKREVLREMLPTLVAEGSRILVFSQFVRMLGLIEEDLKTLGLPYVTLTGSTRDRRAPVQAFQSGEAPVFLISLKAGGTGLNLTAADTVIHVDPWWNPAAEDQATDRAHRIGQTKPVFVYKLIARGTLEERVLGMQEKKRRMAHLVEAAGGATSGELTEDMVEELLGEMAKEPEPALAAPRRRRRR